MSNYLPRFSLRDLFWLVLVSALAIGWWRDRTAQAAKHDQALKELQNEIAVIRVQAARTSQSWAIMNANVSLKEAELAKLRITIRDLAEKMLPPLTQEEKDQILNLSEPTSN